MQAIILLANLVFGKLPFCSLVGSIIGIVAGTLLALSQAALGPGMPPLSAVFTNSLLLALLGWIVVVVLFGFWLHYDAGVIAPPAALNALITAFLTTWLDLKLHHPLLSPLLGMLVGILVGLVLCRFCSPISKSAGRRANG